MAYRKLSARVTIGMVVAAGFSLAPCVADAWNEANQEHRNKLARCLFQEVWIKDKEVVAIKPQPELKPFFDLNYEAMQQKLSQNFGKWRPRRDLK